MIIFVQVVLLLVTVVLSVFFSMAETSITSVNIGRIYRLQSMGNSRAKRIMSLLKDRDVLLRTVLCGNTASNIFAASVVSSLIYPLYGDDGLFYFSIVLTVFILMFGEILPKTYALRSPEKVALSMAPLIAFSVWLMSPIIYVINRAAQFLQHLLGFMEHSETSNIADDVKSLVALYTQHGSNARYDLRMISSITDLCDTEVSAVMTHRTGVFTVNISEPVNVILNVLTATSFSRVPVWRDNPDNVIGILYLKNLARIALRATLEENRSLTKEDIMSSCFEPWYIPDTISLRDQLLEFRRRKIHFAIVINEYGVFQGIVTLEDIIEQIVGSIYDEHDVENKKLIKINENEYMIDGSYYVRDLNRELDAHLPYDEATTIGGMVLYLAERLPEIGESFIMDNITLKVIAIKDNKVSMVQVIKATVEGEKQLPAEE